MIAAAALLLFLLPLRPAAGSPRAAPPADLNIYDAERGLKLSATVLAEMGISLEKASVRVVRASETAEARVVRGGAELVAIVPAAAPGWHRGAAVETEGRPHLRGRLVRRGGAEPGGGVEIVVRLDDPGGRLSPGQFVRLRTVPVAVTGMFLPASSVVNRGTETFVYALNEGHLKRVTVATGRRAGGWIEVTDGLLPGDEVAVGDAAALWIAEMQAVTSGGRCCPL